MYLTMLPPELPCNIDIDSYLTYTQKKVASSLCKGQLPKCCIVPNMYYRVYANRMQASYFSTIFW